MAGLLTRQFGTLRGAVRLGLSYAEIAARLAPLAAPQAQDVRRLVFVCHGNICRSAYAEALAHKAGYNTASFGLSTSSGKPAHADVIRIAEARGVDLAPHQTTTAEDFQPQAGDYLLAMEIRHLRKLAADDKLRTLPRGLLGSFAGFPLPHLHDPYGLDAAYMETCLTRIEDAVVNLCRNFPGAQAS